MNEPLSPEDRRHVWPTLAASLAVVFTLALSPFAWAGVNPPAAESRVPSLSAAASAAQGAAEETTNESLGCGCDEACLVR
jgi:hypothetical protein